MAIIPPPPPPFLPLRNCCILQPSVPRHSDRSVQYILLGCPLTHEPCRIGTADTYSCLQASYMHGQRAKWWPYIIRTSCLSTTPRERGEGGGSVGKQTDRCPLCIHPNLEEFCTSCTRSDETLMNRLHAVIEQLQSFDATNSRMTLLLVRLINRTKKQRPIDRSLKVQTPAVLKSYKTTQLIIFDRFLCKLHQQLSL